MSTPIYIRARHPDKGVRLVRELLELGTPAERLQVVGRRLPADLPVAARRWQPPAVGVAVPALIGAIGLPVLGALLFSAMEALSILMLALLGAALGAGWQLTRSTGSKDPLTAQRDALRRGELIIIADLDDAEVRRVETQIAERHPEVLLLGPDPAGSPPFP
jgi:hypothetical protein